MATSVKFPLLCKQCVVNAVFRRPKILLVFILITTSVIFLRSLRVDKHENRVENSDWQKRLEDHWDAMVKENIGFYIEDKANLVSIPRSWTGEELCPACFGTEMCAAISSQQLQIVIPQPETATSKRGIFFGMYDGTPIVVKRMSHLSPQEFEKYDHWLCRNATTHERCDVPTAIGNANSPALQPHSFVPETFRHAWKISYPDSKAQSLTYAQCLTSNMINMFSTAFDADGDGKLTNDQKAMLFTSMVVQPESLMLKFMKHIKYHSVTPKFYGSCGRLSVVAHAGRPLDSFLDSSFTTRVELALQLISFVGTLWHANEKWFVLYKDFQYENIAVSHDHGLVLIDFEELSIIESADLHKDHKNEDEVPVKHTELCNEECFRSVFSSLTDEHIDQVSRQTNCAKLHRVSGEYMYSRICRNILSDKPEHRKAAAADGEDSNPPRRGLLHSIPKDENDPDLKKILDGLAQVLDNCVTETEPGLRDKTIGDLSSSLFFLTKRSD